ncbi:MAG: hypothetical protein QXD59_02730 [Candidatus Caldarchaeum sp.]
MLSYICYSRAITLLTIALPFCFYFAEGRPEISFPLATQRSYSGEDRVSYLAENSDVIVVGKIVRVIGIGDDQGGAIGLSVKSGPEVRLALTVTVEEVLKGSALARETPTLNVLGVSDFGDVSIDLAEAQARLQRVVDELGRDLQEAQVRFFSSKLTMSRQLIFFLKALGSPPERIDKQQHEAKPLYHYLNALEAESRVMDLVKTHINLAQIKDVERREQELIKLAFSLLRDPQTPEQLAEDAIKDLSFLRVKSAAKWLSDDEIEELVRITTDPKRPNAIRSWASVILGGSIAAERRIDPGPLLRMLEDSSDNVDRRLHVIYVLEQMNTPEIREAVAAILAKEPKTEEDKIVWRALAQSPLAKHQ